MSDEHRPHVPLGIKIKVRQQCYFGCVICGSPVFTYDHVIDYSVVKNHTVENLVLLCYNHHAEKTTGKLDHASVIEAKANPRNKGRAFTSDYRIVKHRNVKINLGSCRFDKIFKEDEDETYHCLWANGSTLMALHHERKGWLTISLHITDEKGVPILVVDRGELVVSTQVWDFTYQGSLLIIRTGSKQVVAQLELTNNKLHVQKGFFLDSNLDGYAIEKTGTLSEIRSGIVANQHNGGNYSNNGFGGIGLINRKIFPLMLQPKGWGSFSS